MDWILAIPLLPVAAFAISALMSNRVRNATLALPILAITGSLGLSIMAFLQVWPGGEEAAAEPVWERAFAFAQIGGKSLSFHVQLDPITAGMLLVITIVAFCVELYSLGYMKGDKRIGWYYSVLSLFSAAMLGLVLAGDFLLLYMSWEVMGLCSYLLIGFWHEEEEPRRASLKAFLVTRVGDVGFALGLALMYVTVGSFAFADVFGSLAGWGVPTATAVALLLLFGAMGKSAQFPLHVWLPDAMAGPTPASALIHAATMVAAGVYLVARAFPIFEAAPVTLTVTMVVGVVTAFVAATMAIVQYDIKKVLAYSTISQLGYMFVALGAGSVSAGLWHLTTHAFFKSLLFLGAGSIIHALHSQDMREMGGINKSMRTTALVFTIGTLALMGIAPLSGFFSKDEILTVLWHEQHYATFAVALLTAGLTAFYMARLWFRVFPGKERGHHGHESGAVMLSPMGLLSLLTAVGGAASVVFAQFLGHEGEWPAVAFLITSNAVALTGILLGWFIFGRGMDTAPMKARFGGVYRLLENKYYLDDAYAAVFVKPYMRASDGLWSFDKSVVDGAVNGVAWLVRAAGGQVRRVQTGNMQSYQRWMVAAAIAFALLAVWKA